MYDMSNFPLQIYGQLGYLFLFIAVIYIMINK